MQTLCASRLGLVVVLFYSAVMLAALQAQGAQQSTNAVAAAVQSMEQAAGAPVKVTLSPVTGFVTFVALPAGRTLAANAHDSTSAAEKSLAFLTAYGQAFGIKSTADLRVTRTQKSDAVGMEHVRLQQTYRGVSVTGGELTVHLRGVNVTAVLAKTLPAPEHLNTTPAIAATEAIRTAQALLSKRLGVTDAVLSAPRLEIFNQGLLAGTRAPTHLAWFIEATKLDLREFIWVDAHRDGVLLHFSQLPHARNRLVFDAAGTSILPGTLVRSEGDPPTGDTDTDAAYDFSGDTYDYFFTEHGRDSYDGAGASLISTVHFCPSGGPCPFANAFWNGEQMVYGDGFSAADDVDAHELTHAVTEFSANLFYYMQSGALNESFSDIFGETVDLTNSSGTDTPAVRWLMGEDVPVFGAIRNMMDPTAFGDPGKVSDTEFVCAGSEFDQGGVHSNSGVPNHAYALMVDGGNYNGFSITGIGLTKAGKIQYRTLTHYLVSGSNFLDNYHALRQSCTDLIGTAGITAADCEEVGKALDAVEMATTPCSQPQEPPLCPVGQASVSLFTDNLENITSGNWTTSTITGVNHWNGGAGDDGLYWSGYATSGDWLFWGFDYSTVGDSTVEMALDIPIPVGGARMQFKHSYEFEAAYDGGVIEYSTNGGATWSDAEPLIAAGATYNGTIDTTYSNPLSGRDAFVRDSFGYTSTQLDLSSLASQNVRFRFRIGTDISIAHFGWFIDDIRIYQCGTSELPDLVVDSFTLSPSTPSDQDVLVFTAVVQNQSTEAAGASRLTLRVGGETQPPEFAVPALAPGATHTITRQAGPLPLGNYQAEATADVDNDVVEENEGNNVATLPFTVSEQGCQNCLIVAGLVAGTDQGGVGATITIPLEVRNAPNQVDALGVDVLFDATVLQFTGFTRGALTQSWTQLDAVLFESGRVRIGGFTTENAIAPSTSGTLVALHFEVLQTCEDGQEEEFSLPLVNLIDDIATWQTCDGCFTCGAEPCDGDVDGNGNSTPGDALLDFQCFLGLPACTPEILAQALTHGDITQNGSITPADALCIFREFLGLPPDAECVCFLVS